MGTFSSEIRAQQGDQQRAVERVADPTVSFSERLREQQRLREQGVQTTSPVKSDIETREAFLGSEVGQERLGEPGLADLGVRLDLGFSDTFGEKKAKFLDKFPEGDFMLVNNPPQFGGGQTILFRRTDSEAFAELDPDLLRKFELGADLADLSGDVPQVVMEALLTRGGGLAKQAIQLFLGNVAGEALTEGVEALRGYQRESLQEVLARASVEGAIAAAGGAATVAVSGPINAVRGAGTLAVSEGARSAQRAANRLGMPALLPNQVARSPLVQKLGGQAAALSSTMGEYIESQQRAIVQTLMGLRDPDVAELLRDNLAGLHERARNQILESVRRSDVSLSQSGEALQVGVAEYDNLARTIVDRAYASARNIEAPVFAFEEVQDVAQQLRTGIQSATAEGGTQRISEVSPDLDVILNEIINATPELAEVTLENGDVFTPTDQLRAWRTRLYDLSTPAPGEIRRESHAQAGRLLAEINRTLNNPQNADPNFLSAWQRANSEAARRFDTMDKLIIREAARTETPAALAARLSKPHQVDNLRWLRRTIPAEQFERFRQGVQADFLAKPETLTKRLDTFDQETLDLLATRETQDQLRSIGNQLDRLKALGAEEITARHTQANAIIQDLIDTRGTAAVEELVRRAGADPNAPIRRTLRAGVMEDLFNKVVSRSDNQFVLNERALSRELERLEQSGALPLLTRRDIETLRDIQEVGSFIPDRPDTGSSLQAGEAVAGARSFSLGAFVTLLEARGSGAFLTSAVGQRLLTGRGREAIRTGGLRVVGAALADMATELPLREEDDGR